jgi:hypothetical protein
MGLAAGAGFDPRVIFTGFGIVPGKQHRFGEDLSGLVFGQLLGGFQIKGGLLDL